MPERMTGATALIRALEAEKVEHIFGIPGGAIIDVYDKLYDSKIRHVLVRHEQVAAHAADGYARASGKVGVCFATSGPGATNLTTGIANAFYDSVPVIAITGQVPTGLIGNDSFQEADTVGIFMPITKYNFMARSGGEIPDIVRRAFMIATSGRKGPVHIDLPKDAQQEEMDFDYPPDVRITGLRSSPKGHPKQIKRAAKELANAERPVIISGGGVIESGATKELVSLAESLMIPVGVTLMGKGSFPDSHPLCLGMFGMHGRRVANDVLSQADVIMAVGMRFSDRVTGKVSTFCPEAKFIHIDIDAAEIGKNVGPHIPIVGDAKQILGRLNAEVGKLKARDNTVYAEKVKEFIKECNGCLDRDFDEKPIKPQLIMRELNRIIDDKTIVVTEVGQCQMWGAHFLKIDRPRQWISSGGLGTMGFGFPASIGAKTARPECTVVDVAGDGSFQMVLQDLATCIIEDLPIVVCLLDNRTLGMVYQWQSLFYNKRPSATQLDHAGVGKGRTVSEVPDFVKIAEAYGAKGMKIHSPAEVPGALEEAFKSDVVTVLDFKVDKEENALPMVPAGGNISNMLLSDMCRYEPYNLRS
jgi:acetolactate synthase-1/2/3 large subunit